MTTTSTGAEPVYTVSPHRTFWIGFHREGDEIPSDEVVIAAGQVDPEIREEGRAWLAAK